MIKITMKYEPQTPEYMKESIGKLDLKKSLSGHLMIFNHRDINIVVNLKEKRIIAYSKGNFSDIVYNTQNRLFEHLVHRGVIEPETVMGTNVFGALGAAYPENKEVPNLSDVILYNIATFIENEDEYMIAMKKAEQEREEDLLDPSDRDSTEYGEVPHEDTKGTYNPIYPGYSYGLAGVYRYE